MTQTSINRLIDQQNVYPYSGILFGNKKESNTNYVTPGMDLENSYVK